MDRAKESVKKVLGKSGHHDTTIHETVAPAVEHETVSQTQHERQTAAIDREVHQDHYHTTEQPIQHSEVLPEQHHHREAAVEHKSFEHDDADLVKRKLAEQQSQYKSHSQRVEGESTRSMEPTVAGEHKHHHVHETIQPVVQKQTIEPHVVHTTVPVHEVHHNAAQHHSASALPPVSMEQFKQQGGGLSGREERKDFFPGEPRSFGGATTGAATGAAGAGALGHSSRRSSSSSSSDDEKKRGLGGSGLGGATSKYGREDGVGQNQHYGTDGGIGNTSTHNTTSTTTSTTTKPSMMDKLNPSKDANGDGQAGFMK